MSIDFWGLGLQAINVLILVWLLSRVFWRPVAAAITARQTAARTMLDDAEATQQAADNALADVTEARAGIEAERQSMLSEAAKDAQTQSKTALNDASAKADKLIADGKLKLARDAESANKALAEQAAELSVEIATSVLKRLSTSVLQGVFLDLLVDAIAKMPKKDRAALAATSTGIDLISAEDCDTRFRTRVTKALSFALGGPTELNFITDPELIAGLEIRTPHFVLHNSWQSDLSKILEDMKHAV